MEIVSDIIFDICFLFIHICVMTVFKIAFFVISLVYHIIAFLLKFIWGKLKIEAAKLKNDDQISEDDVPPGYVIAKKYTGDQEESPASPKYHTADIDNTDYNGVYTLKEFPDMPAGTDEKRKSEYFSILSRIKSGEGYRTMNGGYVLSYHCDDDVLKLVMEYMDKRYAVSVYGYKRKNFDADNLFVYVTKCIIEQGDKFVRAGNMQVGQFSYDVLAYYGNISSYGQPSLQQA